MASGFAAVPTVSVPVGATVMVSLPEPKVRLLSPVIWYSAPAKVSDTTKQLPELNREEGHRCTLPVCRPPPMVNSSLPEPKLILPETSTSSRISMMVLPLKPVVSTSVPMELLFMPVPERMMRALWRVAFVPTILKAVAFAPPLIVPLLVTVISAILALATFTSMAVLPVPLPMLMVPPVSLVTRTKDVRGSL